ncbi:MAG: fumarylacetoacetate hydrolase family protein [Thermodesulfobacteriota bacterium]|nr:fumarylacetoacetate hydrolase family protein [Thermodesulfobacteriota bacterium]
MQIIRFIDNSGNVLLGCDFRDGKASLIEGDIFDGGKIIDKKAVVKQVLAPIEPPAVFCIGLNYTMHARETGMPLPEHPVIFMKNPASITGPGQAIEIPGACKRGPEVDFEAELVVVIKKKAKNVTRENALDYVLGYTCGNDVSARRWQKHAGGGQWVRGKSFDTFCPLGPCIVTADEIKDPNDLDIECRLNGEIVQKSSTSDMIFSVSELVAYISESTTLLPGTLILTGTPSGVGFTRKPPLFLKPGDFLETEIQKIGILDNPVAAESV